MYCHCHGDMKAQSFCLHENRQPPLAMHHGLGGCDWRVVKVMTSTTMVIMCGSPDAMGLRVHVAIFKPTWHKLSIREFC